MNRLLGLRRGGGGFSLFEVVLAIGILSMGLLAVLGLLATVAGNAAEGRRLAELASVSPAIEIALRERGFESVRQALSMEKSLDLYLWLDDSGRAATWPFRAWGSDFQEVWRRRMEETAPPRRSSGIYRATVTRKGTPSSEWALALLVGVSRLPVPGPDAIVDDTWMERHAPETRWYVPVLLRP